MQKWEYMTVSCYTNKVWEINGIEQYRRDKGPHVSVGLQQWGEEGWEICGCVGRGSVQDYVVFLKRPKP